MGADRIRERKRKGENPKEKDPVIGKTRKWARRGRRNFALARAPRQRFPEPRMRKHRGEAEKSNRAGESPRRRLDLRGGEDLFGKSGWESGNCLMDF